MAPKTGKGDDGKVQPSPRELKAAADLRVKQGKLEGKLGKGK